ncbi:MAG: hypothetical protein AAGI24_17020 [Pseudomonadota bacterium]
MTEAEVFELVALNLANCMQAFTVYLTLVFGYLSVSYLAASKLTLFQATTISIIFVLASLSCAFTLLNGLTTVAVITASAPRGSSPIQATFMSNIDVWFYGMGVVTIAGIIASLLFFYASRKQTT